jgi:hypothetical protein
MRLSVPHKQVRTAYMESPIPVVELTRKHWSGFCNVTGLPLFNLGAFYCEVEIEKFPSVFVVINRNLPNYKKLAVLQHELSHYRCYQRHCHCMDDSGISSGTCEAHAILASLLHFQHRGELSPLLFSMEIVVRSLFGPEKQRLAAVKVLQHDIWDDCKAMAGTIFDRWVNSHAIVKNRLAAL